MSDWASYPFDEEAVRAHVGDRERPVCGGFTTVEWNQHGRRIVEFACSHGPVAGCGWRVPVGTSDSLHVLLIFEIDYADHLHREHAWKRLGERERSE